MIVVDDSDECEDYNISEGGEPCKGRLNPKWEDAIKKSHLLVLNREVDDEINFLAAKVAKENDVKVFIDMSGAPSIEVNQRNKQLI